MMQLAGVESDCGLKRANKDDCGAPSRIGHLRCSLSREICKINVDESSRNSVYFGGSDLWPSLSVRRAESTIHRAAVKQ